jgi:hypothetical protein
MDFVRKVIAARVRINREVAPKTTTLLNAPASN